MEEGSEVCNSPKVAAAELAVVGRHRQAMAGATRVRQRGLGGEREGERVRGGHMGWVGLTDPDPGLMGQ
jgi:hypothetical protein